MHRQLSILLVIGAVMAGASGCKREATGQVAAVVNDDEITTQEVNAALAGVVLPPGAEQKPAQQAALERVIDRRLIAQAAEQEGIDKDPEFIIRSREQRELLLAQMLSDKIGRSVRVPAAKAVEQYISSHPNLFSGRTIYTVDQLRFSMDPTKLDQFKPDHSLDAIATRLSSLGLRFVRGSGELDTAKLSPEMFNRLAALPPGEPFIIPEAGVITAAVLTGSKPAPITGDSAQPVAVKALQGEQLRDDLQGRLKTERAKADIKYQTGYAPLSGATKKN